MNIFLHIQGPLSTKSILVAYSTVEQNKQNKVYVRGRTDWSFFNTNTSTHLPQQLTLSLLQGFFVSEDESLHFWLHHLGFDLHLLSHGLDLLHAQLQGEGKHMMHFNWCAKKHCQRIWHSVNAREGEKCNFRKLCWSNVNIPFKQFIFNAKKTFNTIQYSTV